MDYEIREPIDNGFDFHSNGPIDFIQVLQRRAKEPNPSKFQKVFTMSGTHYGWVRADDIPRLIELLDSTEPAAPVVMSASSYIGTQPSTVGHEATNLIEGFRKGHYPHTLNSTTWKFADEMEQYRFKDWCDRFMQSYGQSR